MKSTSRFAFRLFVAAVFVLSMPFAGVAARHYVIPTWYGYGTLTPNAGVIAPYIIAANIPSSMHPGNLPAYLPSQDPAYYSSYRPWNPAGTTAPGYYYTTPAGRLTPYWDGSSWVYRQERPSGTFGMPVTDLNLRSQPSFGAHGNRDRNVVGNVVRGEQVSVVGRYGDWYYIRSAANPQKCGYVYARYVQIQGDFNYAPSPVWSWSEPLYYYSTAWPQPMQPVPAPAPGY